MPWDRSSCLAPSLTDSIRMWGLSPRGALNIQLGRPVPFCRRTRNSGPHVTHPPLPAVRGVEACTSFCWRERRKTQWQQQLQLGHRLPSWIAKARSQKYWGEFLKQQPFTPVHLTRTRGCYHLLSTNSMWNPFKPSFLLTLTGPLWRKAFSEPSYRWETWVSEMLSKVSRGQKAADRGSISSTFPALTHCEPLWRPTSYAFCCHLPPCHCSQGFINTQRTASDDWLTDKQECNEVDSKQLNQEP